MCKIFKGAVIKYDRYQGGRDLDGIWNVSQDFCWGMKFFKSIWFGYEICFEFKVVGK